MASSDLTGLHHVGLVVHDLGAAIDTFRRLGFRVGPPAYPALPPTPGAPPEPVGAGNTHADFPRGFVELLAFAPTDRTEQPASAPAEQAGLPAFTSGLPDDARLVPLAVPDAKLAAVRDGIRNTLAGLADRLGQAEGAHILVLASADAEATAARLDAAAVPHSGARPGQRPITTAAGTTLAPIKYLDLLATSGQGLLPEGRIGAAEDAPADLLDAQLGLDHPNGATALTEALLCVAEPDLDPTTERYERYLGVPAEAAGSTRRFTLTHGRLTLLTPAELARLLPGEHPKHLPTLCAYVIEVTDLPATEALLREADPARPATEEPPRKAEPKQATTEEPLRGTRLQRAATGEPFVPAAAAHGAAIVFRQATPKQAR
ncbi:VOC family protein [Nonomuraea sp. NPDC050328]|uniref:VOC family protein n=1 Tax=Nonomuraea sp. NPDC050328 TaxID=3364361 RepID=UPI0037AFCB8E